MDESSEVFRRWMIDNESQRISNTINEYLVAAWKTAVEWARKDERERLAKLADEMPSRWTTQLHYLPDKVLSGEEIRLGQSL